MTILLFFSELISNQQARDNDTSNNNFNQYFLSSYYAPNTV